jgi:hypothetical protein
LAVTAALERHRKSHRDNCDDSDEPRPLNECREQSNVARQEHGYNYDMKQQIESRAVVARISLPLPTK